MYFDLAGASKGVTDFEAFRLDGSWRAHLSRLFPGNSNEYGWNTNQFNSTLNRNNCAMANVRSASRQDYGISIRTFQLFSDSRHCFFVNLFEPHSKAHRDNVLVSHPTDFAGGF